VKLIAQKMNVASSDGYSTWDFRFRYTVTDFDDTDASRILFTEERYAKPKIHPHYFFFSVTNLCWTLDSLNRLFSDDTFAR
jgi:hypothetical protein